MILLLVTFDLPKPIVIVIKTKISSLLLSTVTLLFWSVTYSLSQEVKVDDNGDKIVVFQDGTWRYFEIQDTILEVRNPTDVAATMSRDKKSPFDSSKVDSVWNQQLYKDYVVAAIAYEAEMVDVVNEIRDQVLDFEDEVRASDGEGKEELKSLKKKMQSDQRRLVYARNLIKKILKIGNKGDYLRLQTIYVPGVKNPSQAVSSANQEGSDETPEIMKEDLISVDQSSDGQLTEEVNSEPIQSSETKEKIEPKPDQSESEAVVDINIWSENDSSKQEVTGNREHAEQPGFNARGVPIFIPAKRLNWSSSVSNNPPNPPCTFVYSGVDEFTQKEKRQLTAELLFTQTDKRLKPYMKNKEYVTCRGFLTSLSGGFRYLTLEFDIASRTARQEYGHLKSGSLLNIKLLNGETVSLFSQGDSPGTIGTGQTTTYSVKYPLDFQKEKIFKKSEIDMVRVVWSTGFEDYEVYNIDFMIKQLACLSGK